jgi:MYXO-CTERM domain-containing protein
MKRGRKANMNIKTLSMTIAAGSLITTGAMADYTGLSQEVTIHGDGTWTSRIYANFSAETDELDAVFGDAEDSLSINSDNGFYQNAFGGPTSADINPALYDAFPSLVNDSWVTIGLEDNVGNNMLNIGIDFDDFENNGGNIFSDNGTWFATPDDAQVLAGADMRVMVGQFTMYGVESHVSGVLNIQGKAGDFVTFQARGLAFDFAAPAPGAIALLGLAGLAGRRRRK